MHKSERVIVLYVYMFLWYNRLGLGLDILLMSMVTGQVLYVFEQVQQIEHSVLKQ